MKTQIQVIPFFPLELMSLPGEQVPLHIFEARYRQLIDDCRNDQILFGIPYVRNKRFEEYGALMQLERIKRVYRNETLDVDVRCVGVFRMLDYRDPLEGKLYSGGEVEIIPNSDLWPTQEVQELYQEYERLNDEEIRNTDTEVDFYSIASRLYLSNDRKYELAKPASDEKKMISLENDLKMALQIKRQVELINDNFHLN